MALRVVKISLKSEPSVKQQGKKVHLILETLK